ncbi:MAG TPA: PIG-L family deacetylase [Bryobacteraceae bacterium]|nr:PIG-L family deacetylase [Bryobacterales bacterium]HRJ18089.1 PIG-L family deacetylase [Bryobacteraceae bacterium]
MLKMTQATAELWTPDGTAVDAALARTTHMSVAAHQDDVEIMAMEGVLAGFGSAEKWFTAAIVTNGAGSARSGIYSNYSDAEMQQVRRVEQKKAAYVGEYSCVAFLDHPSSAVKDGKNAGPTADIAALLAAAQPEVLYTHNLADKHDTHIGVTMHTIRAIRSLPKEQRPKKLYGCEVWRDLDWLVDADKVAFRVDERENVAMALVGVFDSQITGGKRYDLATMGRRRAHATYHESHAVDAVQGVIFGMDLTPLIEDDAKDPGAYVQEYIARFAEDVRARVAKMS